MRDEELTAAIREVQERARSRVPNGSLGLSGVTAPDLMPLVHARDAAEAKVAAIGSVNPRPPGLLNSLIQAVKRRIARSLDWYVREQIEFNRASMACVQASLEAMNEMARSTAALAAHCQRLSEQDKQIVAKMEQDVELYLREANELKDIRTHWASWRVGFEERRSASEIHLLRTVSELQAAFQHRVTLLEQNFRQLVSQTHSEFVKDLARGTDDIQKRVWDDLKNIRAEYEKLIYNELRLIRQKSSASMPPPTVIERFAAADVEIPIDWTRFAETFRGNQDRIRSQQNRYVARFQGGTGAQPAAASQAALVGDVLDLGCGRGEFLEAARSAGVPARGIDLSDENIALCRSKGLAAERADMFAYISALPDQSLGGVCALQVIEHLPPAQLPRLVQLLSSKLRQGALAIFETPNPECLAIFATHFYIDPTHTRPVPPVLLYFYLEEAGFGAIEIERLAPAAESLPALNDLSPALREALFGYLDYAIIAKKL